MLHKFFRFEFKVFAFFLFFGMVALSMQVLTSAENRISLTSGLPENHGFSKTPTPTPPASIEEPLVINPKGIYVTPDVDCDGIENARDNCVLTYNPNQKDRNKNGVGDVCEPDPLDPKAASPACDTDGDGIFVNKDNCPAVCNPDQKDVNKNGIGDVCDPAFPGAITGEKSCRRRVKVKKR